MAIKTILDKIKGQLGADASAELSSLIADAIREADDMTDSLASVNKESKGRKEKLRELESQIEALNEKLASQNPDKLKAEVDRLKAIEGKYNEVLQTQEKELRDRWTDYAKIFSIDETDKRHQIVSSVKDRFRFSDEGKELSIDEVKQNLSAYELLQAAKAFDIPQTGSPQYPPKTDTPAPGYHTSGAALRKQIKT